ncbi:MAG: ASCH domain-containing protein [Candidatus Marinimicrobia bacterium]|nr:ASCH domain-containing protein [Candidatus Neomarinimicrobiota bacterium]
MLERTILMSIKPKYAERIISGEKRVELRRRRPSKIGEGSIVLLYVSDPVQSITGAFCVDYIIEKPTGQLWKLVKDTASVTRDEFEKYFTGTLVGVGIFFSKFVLFPEPIMLHTFSKDNMPFHPPQGFRYISIDDLKSSLPAVANLLSEI